MVEQSKPEKANPFDFDEMERASRAEIRWLYSLTATALAASVMLWWYVW